MSPAAALTMIAAEYREMPGLRLTLAQACRLWHLDAATCEAVLTTLVQAKVLHRTPHGHFAVLPSAGRPLKATLSEQQAARVVA